MVLAVRCAYFGDLDEEMFIVLFLVENRKQGVSRSIS